MATRTAIGTTSAGAADPSTARLLESRQVLPGTRLQTWHAPDVARRTQAGQFVHVVSPARPGLLLPAVPVAAHDRTSGTIELLLDAGSDADDLLACREGDEARLDGPLGRGFRVDARSRHLLIACDAEGFGRVRALLADAVTSGRQVTLLLGARSAADVLPSSLLPDEVEYIVVTEDGSLGHRGFVIDLLARYEAWADQCFAAGSWALLEALARTAAGRDARMGVARLGRRRGRRADRGPSESRGRAWLQVALPLRAGCALGVCLGCVVAGTDGPLRVCREGPAFAAAELDWERPR
jgi:dihydroorotate dehydrogenase electron transfer subunit